MCMVCGSLGRLTKLRTYSFQFWFQVLPVSEERARDDCITHTMMFSLGCYSDIDLACVLIWIYRL